MSNSSYSNTHLYSDYTIILLGLGLSSIFALTLTKLLFIDISKTYLDNKTNTNNTNIKINKKLYKKMYRIIESKGKIDQDPYKRSIDSQVVKKFCKIALANSFDVNNLSDEQFDIIYVQFIDYQINKANN